MTTSLRTAVHVHPLVTVRVCGLPRSVVEALRYTTTWERVDRLRRLRERIEAGGRDLSDVLYPVIDGLSATAVRPRVVALRRALFQGRRPGRGAWNAEVAAALPAAARARVHALLDLLAEYDERHATLPALLAADTERARASLRRTVADTGFRRALSLSSPVLAEEVRKWLADDRYRPRRATLFRLAKYVARAATKTSPYSTFTSSGFGLGPGTAAAGVVELNAYLIRAVERALVEDPALAAARRVRVNPSTVDRGDRLTFLGPATDEPIVTVPATDPVRACLSAVRENPDGTVAGLGRELVRRTGAPDPAPIARYVDRLLAGGLLEAYVPVPDQDADRLGGMLAWVAATGPVTGAAARIVTAATRVHAAVRRPVDLADLDAHHARQAELHAAVADLAAELGPHRPPVTSAVVHENVVHSTAAGRAPRPAWWSTVDDLDVVRRWLAVLDPALPLRLALSRYHRERFGAAVPFLDLHRAVQEAVGGQAGSPAATDVRLLLRLGALLPSAPEPGRSSQPRIRELHRLRQAELRRLHATPDGDGVVRLDPAALAREIDGWPGWLRPPGSLGCYVQPVGDRLVLNVAGTGYGRGRSRLASLLAHDSGERPATHRGELLAELSGTYGSTVNVRAPSTRYEIEYPYTVSGRPADERIPLGDLVVDTDDGLTLRSARLGRRVKPLHLGLMADFLLPPAARLLCLAFGDAHLVHPSIPLLPSLDDLVAPDGIRRHPRTELGRVVLQRARWVVPGHLVPVLAVGETDAAYLLRLATWLRHAGIPDRCFVRQLADLGTADRPEEAVTRSALGKARKPCYLDAANGLLVHAFERAVRATPGVVVFEEALPALADNDGDRVTEFLVEISEDGRD